MPFASGEPCASWSASWFQTRTIRLISLNGIAGEDPNWGRIVAAVGKSGAAADRDLLTIHFGDVLVAENGWVAPSYTEEAGAALMKEQDITINIGLGLGDGKCTVWTCDLTHQYITINADYRS